MPTDYPEVWAALAAPFGAGEVKHRDGSRGAKLQYITARTAMNRLDAVLGPENWWDSYAETKEGLKCRITVRLPDGREVSKEDGGGFAGMAASDDDEKSAFSDAFKRACVKLGVGRYLYRDGTPTFAGREPPPERPSPAARPAPAPDAGEPPGGVWTPWVQWFYTTTNDGWAAHLERHRVDREERGQLVQHPEEVVNLVCSHAIGLGHIEPKAVAKVNGNRDSRRARAAVTMLFAKIPAKVKAYVREHFRGLAEAECARLGIDPGPYAATPAAAADDPRRN